MGLWPGTAGIWLELPDEVDIHMVEEFGELSFTISGRRNEDGSTSAIIPDVLLQSGKTLSLIFMFVMTGMGKPYGQS